MVDFLWFTRLHISSWNSRKIQILQEQGFISVYLSAETLVVLFQIKNYMDSHIEYYQEASATSSFSIISLQRIQHQMVGQIKSWVRLLTKDLVNNFKVRLIKFKRLSKFFSRTDTKGISNFEKQMSSFNSPCYWFRAVSSRTHSNSQIVCRSLRKWRNWIYNYIRWFLCRPWVNPLRRTYGSIQIKDFKNRLYNCTFVQLFPYIYPIKK